MSEWSSLKINDVSPGDQLLVGPGFRCLKEGAVVKVWSSRFGGLSVACDDGEHALHGQKDEDGHLIGFRKA